MTTAVTNIVRCTMMNKQAAVYTLRQLSTLQRHSPVMRRLLSTLRRSATSDIVLRGTIRRPDVPPHTVARQRYVFGRPLTASPLRTPKNPETTNVSQSTNEQLESESGFPLVQPAKVVNQSEGLNLLIDERAAWRLGQIFKDSKEVMRVTVESGGCHGFQYNLELIPGQTLDTETGILHESSDKGNQGETAEEDEFDVEEGPTRYIIYVLPNDGGKVIIDEKSLKILNNSVLTYTKELIGSSFKITSHKLKSRCGCGTSFDIDI